MVASIESQYNAAPSPLAAISNFDSLKLTISDFNNKYDNRAKEKTLTWRELVERLKTLDERVEKDGPLCSPAQFKVGPHEVMISRSDKKIGITTSKLEEVKHHRCNECVLSIYALVLEFDSKPDLTPKMTLDRLVELTDGYECVIYTTHSHTPKAPRLRLILPYTRPIEPTEHEQLWLAGCQKFGAGMADTSKKAVSSMYYYPSHKPRAEHYAEHYSGKLLDPDELKPSEQDKPSSNGYENPSSNGHDKTYRNSDFSASTPAHMVKVDELIFNPNASISEDMLTLLSESEKFKLTWVKQRSDLKNDDSRYCLSLANFGVYNCLDDQHILNMMIEWRRKYNAQSKPFSWYVGRIEKARKVAMEHAKNMADVDETVDDGDSANVDNKMANVDDIPQVVRGDNALRKLQQHPVFAPLRKQDVNIVSVRKLGRTRGHIEFVLSDKTVVELGEAAKVLTPRDVQAAIADAVPGAVIKEFTRARWRSVAELIMQAAGPGQDTDRGPDGQLMEWLAAFVGGGEREGRRVCPIHPPSETLAGYLENMVAAYPNDWVYRGHCQQVGFFWTPTGELVIHTPSLLRWLQSPAYGARASRADVNRGMIRLGFRPERLNAPLQVGERRKIAKAHVWISRPDFDPFD
jgi:hypothetical protein